MDKVLEDLLKQAKQASRKMMQVNTQMKNKALKEYQRL